MAVISWICVDLQIQDTKPIRSPLYSDIKGKSIKINRMKSFSIASIQSINIAVEENES